MVENLTARSRALDARPSTALIIRFLNGISDFILFFIEKIASRKL